MVDDAEDGEQRSGCAAGDSVYARWVQGRGGGWGGDGLCGVLSVAGGAI